MIMTEPSTMITETDPADPSLATGATGLLRAFNVAGVLGPADVHAATAIARLAGEADDRVRLALALAVRAVRAGSVCIDLAQVHTTSFDSSEVRIDTSTLPWPEPEAWLDAVRASPMVADGHDHPGGRPLRLAHGLLYLERYWLQEEQVRTEWLRREAEQAPAVDLDRLRQTLGRLFTGSDLPDGEPDRQRLAAAVAALRWVSVIAGGPGTGKTTTVARVLALLLDQPETADGHRPGRLRIALAAPTGKAAARLAEAVREAAARLPEADRARLGELGAATLHRLLGWLPGSRGRFRYHSGNHLPYDVIVVDETSMVSLTLMARLLEAVRPDARLIFVGDPDQLSSVEAGAVLADIATAPGPEDVPLARSLAELGLDGEVPTHGVVRLTHTWRYGGAIDELAQAIRRSDPDTAIDVLRSGADDVLFVEGELDRPVSAGLEPLREQVRQAGRLTHDAALSGDVLGALAGLDQHRLLCAHRQGPYGVARWGAEAEHWLIEALGPPSTWRTADTPGPSAVILGGRDRSAEWYPGRPLLITANDYELGLYNGDTGVVVATEAGPRAAFSRGATPTVVSPVRLDAVQTVHAMTVHRAQGSQFRCVSFVVPPPDSPLLTRELLYTAVTRATDRVQVFGTVDAIRRAILHPANRASGLRPRLR